MFIEDTPPFLSDSKQMRRAQQNLNILWVNNSDLFPGLLHDPGDGESLVQTEQVTLRPAACDALPDMLGLSKQTVCRDYICQEVPNLMSKVCAVEKVELVFWSSWQLEGLLSPVRTDELRGSPHGGWELESSLRSNDDGLVRKVDPAVSDQSRRPAPRVSEADAGGLVPVTALPNEVTGRGHDRPLPSEDHLGELHGVHSEVEDAAATQLLLVQPVNLYDSSWTNMSHY